MNWGDIVELLAIISGVLTNFMVIGLLNNWVFDDISEPIPMIAAGVSSVTVYILGRLVSFRHNIGAFEQEAIKVFNELETSSVNPVTEQKYVAFLSSKFGKSGAKMIYDSLLDRCILTKKKEKSEEVSPQVYESVIKLSRRAKLL